MEECFSEHGNWSVSSLDCVASVSNRVIGRKLERKQKKGCPSFLDEPREETLATQAISSLVWILQELEVHDHASSSALIFTHFDFSYV